jgi:exfoliative toxin A/B
MSDFLKKYPIPVVGLILGLAAAGNLVQTYGSLYRNILGIISAILFILMLLKIMKYPKSVAESLQNPVIGGVFPTFTMAIMILSTYLKPYAAAISYIMWIIGFVLHIVLILWFTKKFVLNFKIKQVFPSWFVVYVGIAAASVTAPTYNMIIAGKLAFWFGFATYLILLPIIIYRVVRIKELPEQTLPTVVIFSAPASLLLAGYMNSFQVKTMAIVWILMILSVIMYCVVLTILPKLLTLKFYPSYSSFTFPLIISGIAIKLTNGFLVKTEQVLPLLKYLIKFQEAIGVGLTLYVLIRYILFLLPVNRVTLNLKSEAK